MATNYHNEETINKIYDIFGAKDVPMVTAMIQEDPDNLNNFAIQYCTTCTNELVTFVLRYNSTTNTYQVDNIAVLEAKVKHHTTGASNNKGNNDEVNTFIDTANDKLSAINEADESAHINKVADILHQLVKDTHKVHSELTKNIS